MPAEVAVDQIIAAGRSAWPSIASAIDDAAFRRTIEAKLSEAGVGVDERALLLLHAPELFLALACASGHREALAVFDAQLLSQVAGYVARIDRAPEFADEVKQRLREKLFVGGGGEPPKIAGYSGRGPLAGWLRVAAIRTARDFARSRAGGAAAAARATDAAEAAGIVGAELDPELQYMKRHYANEFRAAFSETLGQLTAQQRNVLALHFLEGMSSAAIGEMYGVTGAAVRLWIKQYRADLLAETRRMLADRLELAPSELSSVLALVQSQMDASISRLLRLR